MTARNRRLSFVMAALLAAATALPGASRGAEPAPKAERAATPTVVAPSALPHRVVVYYFHTTARCATCRSIEAYSREAIEAAFAKEIKDGRLVFQPVNIELEGNQHFAKDYGLYTKSLILVNEVRGKAPEWKNLEKVWQLAHDKPRFVRYVQEATRGYLGDRS